MEVVPSDEELAHLQTLAVQSIPYYVKRADNCEQPHMIVT